MRNPVPAFLLSCGLAALAVSALPARAARVPVDRGTFVIYSWDRPVGRETFSIDVINDTVVVASEAKYLVDVGKGPEDVRKSMRYAARSPEWRFIAYNSTQNVRDTEFQVGGVPGSDTTVSVYHEVNRNGTADVYWRPRGRLFVLDAMMYANIQTMLASLPAGADTATLAVLALGGQRDTVVAASLSRSGSDTLPWGGKPVTTRTLRLEQDGFGFDLWVDPAGRLLRIAHVPSGLRVDREPPAVKRRATTPKPKPGG